jgi:hypothetical protein
MNSANDNNIDNNTNLKPKVKLEDHHLEKNF